MKDNSNTGKGKAFMSKLSGAFMVPVAVMSIAGLFIGIGSAIVTGAKSADNLSALETFGTFLKNIGNPIFSALPVLFLIAVTIAFTDEAGIAVFAGVVGFLIFNAIQTPFINTVKEEGLPNKTYILGIKTSDDIAIKMSGIAGTNLGIVSLNTSIFGGIIVGFIAVYAYKKFYDIKMPMALSFYSGKRFVGVVIMLMMIPLGFLFLLIWPWIGLGFAYFGEYSGKVSGLDSFIFSFTERALIPFGLHHIFYSTLYYTAAGGDIVDQFNTWTEAGGTIIAIDGENKDNAFFLQAVKDGNLNAWQGERNGWLSVSGTGFINITYQYADGTSGTLKILDFVDEEVGLDLGRYQNKTAVLQFGLPAAALAMALAAPKERRKEAISVCLPAAVTCFLVGITEPIEFTFLFLSPFLFWGFHCVMIGIAGLVGNFLGTHGGNSGGIIATISSEILPVAQGTNFWWEYVIGVVIGPIYFFVFYWYIKHFNLATPGRGESTGFISRKVYTEIKNKKSKNQGLDEKSKQIILALGGWNNIINYNNCASRLRYDIKNKKLVDEKALKSIGAFGIIWKGDKHIQIIIGTIADQLNVNIKTNIGASLK